MQKKVGRMNHNQIWGEGACNSRHQVSEQSLSTFQDMLGGWGTFLQVREDAVDKSEARWKQQQQQHLFTLSYMSRPLVRALQGPCYLYIRNMVGRTMPPKDVHALIPKTCKYVTLHS